MERISSFFFAFFLFGKLVWMWIILCRQIAETQVIRNSSRFLPLRRKKMRPSLPRGPRMVHAKMLLCSTVLRKASNSALVHSAVTRSGRVRVRQNISIKLLPLMRCSPSSRYTGKGWAVAAFTNSSTSRTEPREIINSDPFSIWRCTNLSFSCIMGPNTRLMSLLFYYIGGQKKTQLWGSDDFPNLFIPKLAVLHI